MFVIFAENCGYATVLDKIRQRTGSLLEYPFIPMTPYRTVICICNLDSLCFPWGTELAKAEENFEYLTKIIDFQFRRVQDTDYSPL